jgi:GNAT superfamily N-acetyltransferase
VGTLTDAFDEDPMFPFPWQPPHYPGLLEAAGYRPTYPFWVFDIDFSSERHRSVSRRSLKGRMGPLQIARLLLGARRYRRAGLVAIGVLESQRGRHIGHTLAAALYRRYEELGLPGALYYPVNDRNLASRRFAESFGGTGWILYHAYDKPLG